MADIKQQTGRQQQEAQQQQAGRQQQQQEGRQQQEAQQQQEGRQQQQQAGRQQRSAAGVPVAVLGDLNTMANGVARLSPHYCCDHMRWRTLGCSEAQFWHRHVFAWQPTDGRVSQASWMGAPWIPLLRCWPAAAGVHGGAQAAAHDC